MQEQLSEEQVQGMIYISFLRKKERKKPLKGSFSTADFHKIVLAMQT